MAETKRESNERAMLISMAKRLEEGGKIDDLRISRHELSYHSDGWHGYWVRFQFDDNGNVIETSAGC